MTSATRATPRPPLWVAALLLARWLGAAGAGEAPSRVWAQLPRAIAQRVLPAAGGMLSVYGVDYGPFRDGQSPNLGIFPTPAHMQEDMPKLREMVRVIRTYSVTNGFDQIPAYALLSDLQVVPSAWIGTDTAANDAEIASLITVANTNANVPYVCVGSEVLHRGDRTKAQLIAYVQQVKAAIAPKQVTTAETLAVWQNPANADLAAAVDFIFVNIYPFWSGQSVTGAAASVMGTHAQLKTQFAPKRVVISETGWPTAGPAKDAAVPNVENQRTFVEDFVNLAAQQQVDFFFFSAFDEAWKWSPGGDPALEVERYWGFYTSARAPKHPSQVKLPALVTEWRAERRDRLVCLTWRAAAGSDVALFRVLRAPAPDGVFQVIGSVPARPGICTFEDKDAPERGARYRLEVVDTAGRRELLPSSGVEK